MEQYHASKEALVKIPLDIFKYSFVIGTTLLVLYAITKHGSLLLLGFTMCFWRFLPTL
jgi:lipid-A-disaccharide synthase-like uncharacterized protein